MATTRGRCTNTDYCTLASQRKTIDVPLDSSFICPECAAPLRAPALEAEARPRRGGAIIAGVLVLLTGVGAAAYFAGGSSRTMTVASVPPPPAPPVPKVQPAATVAVPVPVPQPSRTVLFRMRGSNTIGAGLGPKLAAAFLADEGDSDVKVHPLAAADETEVTGLRGDVTEAIVISAHGSATAFTGLAAGDTEIGMASRRIKPAEHDALGRLGDMTGAGSEHVLALDGIAVIANPANPVGELTKAQLRDVFGGAISDWGQLGGTKGPIHVFARDDKSGTFDTFKALVLDKTKLAPGARRVEDSRELAADVAADPAAIGFVGLPYVAETKPVAVAETGAQPLLANPLTVATEDYPLSRRLYLYTPAVGASRIGQRFVTFALSPAGQAVVEQTGFVPLTIKTQTVSVPQTASGQYKALVGGAQRLSTDFRFQPNLTGLDNRGLRDLDRLVNFLISTHSGGDRLVLVGFADNQGSKRANYEVSRKRADSVSALLARRGIKVGQVSAFGSDLPVADNGTEEGRDKNRRVEVYVLR